MRNCCIDALLIENNNKNRKIKNNTKKRILNIHKNVRVLKTHANGDWNTFI